MTEPEPNTLDKMLGGKSTQANDCTLPFQYLSGKYLIFVI